VLYETLTGIPPFDGDNVNAIMYATVNAVPPAPSSKNAEVPTMLDLIVAKALAKSIDERYQSMREFAGDLNQVKRMLAARQVDGKMIAKQSPPTSKPVSLESLGVGRYQTEGVDEVKPLKLAKDFDSFDATLKLAAMTNQTGEFKEYISETQKMRAYKGQINQTGATPSPVQPSGETGSATTLTFAQMDDLEEQMEALQAQQRERNLSDADLRGNLLPIAIIVLLAALAVGLSIALLLR
jgi:eukaryotic-like serine/threonine-protein kinase